MDYLRGCIALIGSADTTLRDRWRACLRPGTSVSLPPSARQTPMRFGDDDPHRSSLGSSDSHSSVARSEDYSQDYVAEEDETVIYQYTEPETAPPPTLTTIPANFNPYLTYREAREDEAMECD
nr:hypothetical protein HCOI_01374800 [Haemonchus contortus]